MLLDVLFSWTLLAGCPRAAMADVVVGPDQSLSGDYVRVGPLMEAGACTGFRILARERHVADVRLGPGQSITATKVEASQAGQTAALRLSGLTVAEGAARLAEDSHVTVELADGSAWPTVRFDLRLEAFDVGAWQTLVGGTLPFHYLVCEQPEATMFYQGGGMIPLPEVDPFPLTAKGLMAGEWADGWSYAPPMAAWAVPAVGLWSHRAETFVAYDLNTQRHTDRSGELIASAGFLGAEAPAFCLVHPYQKEWIKLTYPAVPSRVASRFELIYTSDLPDRADPNQFVLERLWREHRDLLPPIPRMNDLAWIPEYDAFTPNGGIEPTAVGTGVTWTSGRAGLEGYFVEVGSKMLGNDFITDGILRARALRPDDPLERLRADLDYLMPRCSWVDIDGDRCATWVHPIEGKFQDRWGGERCAGVHYPGTFQIGAAMLRVYEATGDERFLPYIDGVYNWCKHYLFTRNGVCDLPWAMFSREATAVGENFLLSYRQVFRDDPERGARAEEALTLARTALYKTLWFYTADPDLQDDLDPTFLNQATNDGRWAGRVTWNEAGWVLRTMVPLYCETGDPFLKYLLRGSIERYYAGFREDGGIAENLQIFGETEPKGVRTGGFPDAMHGGNVRRWARPLAPAKVRVAMGQRAALAFCLGTRAYDIKAYRFAPPGGFAFRLVALPGAPRGEAIDLIATAPFRDLRGLLVKINGQPLADDRIEFNQATAGEDVFIQGVRPGDEIEIGDTADAQAVAETPLPYRDGPPPADTPWRPVDLRQACNVSLQRDWWQDGAWFGLSPGRRTVWGIPVDLVDPATNDGRDAVVEGAVEVNQRAAALFLVVGRLRSRADTPRLGTLTVTLDEGEPRRLALATDVPFDLTNGFPLRKFDTYLAAIDLGATRTVRSLAIEGATLLAVTLAGADSSSVRAALAQADATRFRTLSARARQFYQAPLAPSPDERPWAPGMSQPWRFRLTALPASAERADALLIAREDFGALLRQVGLAGTVHPQSVRAVEVGIGAPAPVQFDPLPGGDGQQGELLLRMPGTTPAGVGRSFDVYFGPEAAPETAPAVHAEAGPDAVRVDTGRGGLRFEFALEGAAGRPRWIDLAFDADADGDLAEEANLLGDSGYNGGFGDLSTCTDWLTWYDFGGLQTTGARAEIENAGPVATTVRVSGLELWGQGDAVSLGTREDGTPYGAAPAGEADWRFRFYAGKPLVEQWLEYGLDRLDHGWTRPMQVRYGLRSWGASGTRSIDGRSLGFAESLAVAALPPEANTLRPECMFTPDGNVLQVAFTRPDALGRYYTGRWAALPTQQADDETLLGGAVEQQAVEARVDGRLVRAEPQPLPLVEFDRTLGQGPGPRAERREVVVGEGNLSSDPSFEQGEAFWALGANDQEARWTTTHVYSGERALDLSCTDRSLSIVSTNARGSHALNVQPNALYEVTFQAKCTSGEGEVHANFYGAEPGCDFLHIITPIPADSTWRPVRVEVPTGNFEPRSAQPGVFARSRGLAPALRLWTYQKTQTTYVDHVEVRRLR